MFHSIFIYLFILLFFVIANNLRVLSLHCDYVYRCKDNLNEKRMTNAKSE